MRRLEILLGIILMLASITRPYVIEAMALWLPGIALLLRGALTGKRASRS